MNLPDFRALLAEYALENPNRPLSTVTVREFDAWLECRQVDEQAKISLLDLAKCRECGVALVSDYDKTVGVCSAKCAALFYGLPAASPDLIIIDEVDELSPERRQYLRESVVRWEARREALQEPEGSPRCALCKDSGWRPSAERGRKVPCECGARGMLANIEALARGHKPR